MEILISNKAQENINNITEFTLNISINYANKIINEIYNIIESIGHSPYTGRYVPELNNKAYREKICKEYRIIYSVLEEQKIIFVKCIISGKQNSDLFFKIHKKDLFN